MEADVGEQQKKCVSRHTEVCHAAMKVSTPHHGYILTGRKNVFHTRKTTWALHDILITAAGRFRYFTFLI